MKLLDKIGVFVTALLLSSTVSAGTMYWQITSDTGTAFTEAAVVVTQGGARVARLGSTTATDLDADTHVGTYVTLQETDISAYSDSQYSFFVEMVNYSTDPETVTQGNTYSYDDLLSAHYVSLSPDDVTTVTAAALAANMGASSVPEPSSGLLLMMGGALLALRRRRQK